MQWFFEVASICNDFLRWNRFSITFPGQIVRNGIYEDELGLQWLFEVKSISNVFLRWNRFAMTFNIWLGEFGRKIVSPALLHTILFFALSPQYFHIIFSIFNPFILIIVTTQHKSRFLHFKIIQSIF